MAVTEHPEVADLPYRRSSFVVLDSLARAHGHDPDEVRRAIAAGQMPGVAYVLADGTQLVAPDYFALADLAGSFASLREWFVDAYDAAAAQAAGRSSDAGTGEERRRFGPVSRDRCVTAVRERFELELPPTARAG